MAASTGNTPVKSKYSNANTALVPSSAETADADDVSQVCFIAKAEQVCDMLINQLIKNVTAGRTPAHSQITTVCG